MLVFSFRQMAKLPLAWLHAGGAVIGWLAYALSPAYAKRLRQNLSASGVCAGADQRAAMLSSAIAEAGKGAAEVIAVWFAPEERVRALVIECRGWEAVEAAHARGRGILFLTPHLGCFEVAAAYAAWHMPITVLYRPPKMGWLEPLMVAGRTRWCAAVAPASIRGVRALYRALARGEAVGLLPDQAPGAGEGTWAPFFGRLAYTMTLVRRLQERSGATMIMAFAERLPHGRGYRLHLEPVPDRHFDETALNRAIEAMIRRRPEQYLWSYNRYKVPAGAEPSPATERRES